MALQRRAGERRSAVEFSVLEAPSILGLRPSGVELLPEALRHSGLAARLGAARSVRVDPPGYDARRDPVTGLRNVPGIAAYTERLADAVGDELDSGRVPVVLGGDCSILLGPLLALRRRGRPGLLFIDGHADFYEPEANVNGEVASSELAFATGRGPPALTVFNGHSPLVEDPCVVAFGHRDAEEAATYGSQPLPPEMWSIDLAEVRARGVARAAGEAVAHLGAQATDGFWVHFDVDVLDDAIMPAVDHRLPGGLTWEEAAIALGTAWRSGRAVGLDLTIFNPRLDPEGHLARRLVDLLADAMH